MSKYLVITKDDLAAIKELRDKMKEAMFRTYIPGPNVNEKINSMIERLESSNHSELIYVSQVLELLDNHLVPEDKPEYDEVYSRIHNNAIQCIINKLL